MRLHHIRLAGGRPAERGEEYAAASGSRIPRSVEAYWAHYLRVGGDLSAVEQRSRETLRLLSDWSPEQADEIRATASGLGIPAWRLTGVVARTEVLATLPGDATECTVVVVLPADGPPRSVQTWDWDADLATDGVLLEYRSGAGLGVSTFTEFGMTAKIGVNSAGLGVHLNILRHESDGQEPGIPVHCLVREVLSRADSVAAAEAVIRSTPAAASSAITVVTSDGAATFEVSPQGVARIEPEPAVGAAGATRLLWHTNHFRDPALADGDAAPPTSTTHARAAHVESRLAGVTTAGRGLQELAGALCGPEGEGAPVCLVPGNGETAPWTTLLTAGIEVTPSRLALHPGTPATVPIEPELEAQPCAG